MTSVHNQAGIRVQINTLEIKTVEKISIQFRFNVTMLKQRWTNVISAPFVCRVIVWKRTTKTFTIGCNLRKITSANLFLLHFINYVCNVTSKITLICHSPKPLCIVASSILLKLYNVLGYKTLTWFCFKDVNKFFKKRSQRRIKDPVKTSKTNYFCKNKNNFKKFS